MPYATEERPMRLQSDKLLFEELRNELMIYDPDRNKAFCLNETASFVWKHSDGETSVAEIGRRLSEQLGAPVNEEMIWFALDVLSKDGLLAAAPGVTIPMPTVSRRDLLQKMGVGAMALPLVTALFVSPAKAHASSMGMPPSNMQENTPPAAVHHHSGGGMWSWLADLF